MASHPAELGAPEVEAFLPHLAVGGQVVAATQNQALAALLFSLSRGAEPAPALAGQADPRQAAGALAGGADGAGGAATARAHGGCSRTSRAPALWHRDALDGECVRLRVKDVDFAARQITVRMARATRIG